jgi:hypothetical protein
MLCISGRERQREMLCLYMCSGGVVISSRPEHCLRMLRRGRRVEYMGSHRENIQQSAERCGYPERRSRSE